jgi:hypothetical protein
MCLAAVLNTAVVFGTGAAFAAELPPGVACVVMSGLDGYDLTTYQFESDAIQWERLPVDRECVLGEVRIVQQRVFEVETNTLHGLAPSTDPRAGDPERVASAPRQTGQPARAR